MMISDIDKMLPVDTFIIGQQVWCVHTYSHRFWIHEECTYCKNSGKITYKGKIFECPNCNDRTYRVEVKQMIVDDDPVKINSKITLENNGSEPREYYATDKDGLGWLIQKSESGNLNFYSTKEEAQKYCDNYNKEKMVYQDIERYKKIEVKR